MASSKPIYPVQIQREATAGDKETLGSELDMLKLCVHCLKEVLSLDSKGLKKLLKTLNYPTQPPPANTRQYSFLPDKVSDGEARANEKRTNNGLRIENDTCETWVVVESENKVYDAVKTYALKQLEDKINLLEKRYESCEKHSKELQGEYEKLMNQSEKRYNDWTANSIAVKTAALDDQERQIKDFKLTIAGLESKQCESAEEIVFLKCNKEIINRSVKSKDKRIAELEQKLANVPWALSTKRPIENLNILN